MQGRMVSGQPETLYLRPVASRYLALWLVLTHTTALIVLWQLHLSMGAKAMLSLGLLVYLVWQIRCHLLRRNGNSIIKAVIESDGLWRLTLQSGKEKRVELQPYSFVRPWLMILNFKSGAVLTGLHLTLLPDSLDRELARKLRIRLHQDSPMPGGRQSGG